MGSGEIFFYDELDCIHTSVQDIPFEEFENLDLNQDFYMKVGRARTSENLRIIYLAVISFLGWDTLFFIKFKRRTYWKKNHGWLLIERATLHLPLIISTIWMFYNNIESFVDFSRINEFMLTAVVFIFKPWFLWDH